VLLDTCRRNRAFCERLDNLSLIYTFVFRPNLIISSPLPQIFGAIYTLISPDEIEVVSTDPFANESITITH